eukprot:CAMPEP_0197579272 /NCGR_PEP_ID=MMETSP1326-20131121/3307_1 /TAXON_ID=1155430 /ORGANISM="Genus nov. species nov., Strain RCC2288" /LENGTH=172 /DNA_ID=CAMNT_0043142683 /DNA_START=477 /DNA_END=995 /DNA_ORIENTATION=-
MNKSKQTCILSLTLRYPSPRLANTTSNLPHAANSPVSFLCTARPSPPSTPALPRSRNPASDSPTRVIFHLSSDALFMIFSERHPRAAQAVCTSKGTPSMVTFRSPRGLAMRGIALPMICRTSFLDVYAIRRRSAHAEASEVVVVEPSSHSLPSGPNAPRAEVSGGASANQFL